MSESFVRKSSGLVRQASLFDTFVFNASASSIGAILLFYVFVVTFADGGNLLAAIPVALIAISMAVTFAMLTATFPRSGGDYIFNSRILHPSLGFSFNFSLVFWQLFFSAFTFYLVWLAGIGPGLQIIGFLIGNPGLGTIGVAMENPVNAFILGTITNILFAVLSSLGTKKMLIANNIVFILSLLGIVTAIVVMATVSRESFVASFNSFMQSQGGPLAGNATSNAYQTVIATAKSTSFTVPPFGFSWAMVALAASAIMWTFYSTYIGGEIKGANSVKRNIVTMVGSAIFNVILVALLFWAMFKTMGYEFIASLSWLSGIYQPGIPWGNAAEAFIGMAGLVASNPILSLIIVLGITLSASLLFAIPVYMQIVRCLFAWSIDRLVPDKISEVSPRFHSPIFATLVTSGAIELFLVLLMVFQNQFYTIYALTVIGPAFSCLFLPGISGMLLPYLKKDVYEASPAKREVAGIPVISIFGAIQVIWMLLMAYWYTAAYPGFGLPPGSWGFYLNFMSIPIGFVLYSIIKALRKRQGIDISLAFKEMPPV